LVEPNTVREHLSKSGFGFLKVEPTKVRFEEPLGSQLRIGPVEAQGPLLRSSEFLTPKPIGSRCVECAEKARSHEADKKEVVEVPRLEGRVLAIVGKAEELPREHAKARIVTVHPPQRAGNQHRGSRTTPFSRQ